MPHDDALSPILDEERLLFAANEARVLDVAGAAVSQPGPHAARSVVAWPICERPRAVGAIGYVGREVVEAGDRDCKPRLMEALNKLVQSSDLCRSRGRLVVGQQEPVDPYNRGPASWNDKPLRLVTWVPNRRRPQSLHVPASAGPLTSQYGRDGL